jgi:hypothetical protein
MGRLKCVVEVDVSSAVPLTGTHVIRGTMVAPTTPAGPFVWCCLPGGGCTSSYFDLSVDGHDTSYSMASQFVDAGDVVLALDHLGTGASSRLEDDFLLTPDILAAAHHSAFSTLLGRLSDGTLVPEISAIHPLVPIGLGHSLGAMITIVQQARHGTYSAVANLGSMGAGLPQYLSDPQWANADMSAVRSSLVDMARVQFGAGPSPGGTTPSGARGPLFHAEDVPLSVRAAFRNLQTRLLPSCALATLIPSFTDTERAMITVPLFIGIGEHDLSPDPHDSVRRYTSATDVTLVVLPGSSHCHNQAGNRRQLWERLLVWARSVPNMSGKDSTTNQRAIV